MTLIEIESYESELELVKNTYLRYNILRLLFPFNRMSFIEIQSSLNMDKSNLSRKLRDLKDLNLVMVTKEQRGKGAPSQIFTLSDDGRKILNLIVELKSPRTSNTSLLPDKISLKNYLRMLITEDEVIDSRTLELITNEIQILTRNFYIPIDDELLFMYKKAIKNEKLKGIIFILLLSIKNMITSNNDDKTIEEIEGKLGSLLLSLKNKKNISDRAKKIAGEINDKLRPSIKSYPAMKTRYLHSIRNVAVWAPQIGDIGDKILALYPLKKHEIKFILIKEFIISDDSRRKILEQEINRFR